MSTTEFAPLHIYSDIIAGDDAVYKICAVPEDMTRQTAADLDVFLRQQLFHALIDPLEIPGILPLDWKNSWHFHRPDQTPLQTITLAFPKAEGVCLQSLKDPVQAFDMVRVIHAATRTLLSVKSAVETAFPGQRFLGHKDLKPDCLFINGAVTILDWQTYDITPAVPAVKHRMHTPDFSSVEHLLTDETGILSHDVVSMAKILLHGILGDNWYPSTPDPKPENIPDQISDPQMAPQRRDPKISKVTDVGLVHWKAIQEHTLHCIGIIDNLLSVAMTEADERFKHPRINPACIDAQPDILLLIRDILRRDIVALKRPEKYPRMTIYEFAEQLALLDPLYPDVSGEVRVPRIYAYNTEAFQSIRAVSTQPVA